VRRSSKPLDSNKMSDASIAGVKAHLNLSFRHGFLESWEIREIRVEDRSLPAEPMPLNLSVETNGQEIKIEGPCLFVQYWQQFANTGATNVKFVHLLLLKGAEIEIATDYPCLTVSWDGTRVSVTEI